MIYLLETDNNKRGDLFSRRMQDLFHALGYTDFRLDVAKTGREVDIRGSHRLESRIAIAECKATKKRQGGDAVNKFAGVFEAERLMGQTAGASDQYVGYFVSLGGFAGSAVEQEQQLGTRRVVLLGPTQIQAELIAARIVVAEEAASATAVSCLAGGVQAADITCRSTLTAWREGWLWFCDVRRAGADWATVVIHADGYPLDLSKATEALEAATAAKIPVGAGPLRNPEIISRRGSPSEAIDRYSKYLLAEFGAITIDGLPADQDVGSRRIALEDLYVPLGLQVDVGTERELEVDHDSEAEDAVSSEIEEDDEVDESTYSVGDVMGQHRHVAVLGLPGAGKSTLLKALVVHYASTASTKRTITASPDLPSAPLLPLVIRCRQLGEAAGRPIREALSGIAARAEMAEYEESFDDMIGDALRDGRALLLIDGLDEIASDRNRVAFVKQLRTFLGTYPSSYVVTTSRQAGFRVVAGALGDVCERYKLAPFDEEDITALTVAWHRLVVGTTPEIEEQARALAASILAVRRVSALAVNPLLLTTLLLVKRWVGELPRKRTVLYQKAIEVLLMTWNVEGHAPLELDEAVPQLAYLAHHMTVAGVQSLTAVELERVLGEARRELPDILGYSTMTPSAFVARVEERSSLLSLSGHKLVDGVLSPFYEFKHLTFQEYLAAYACVNGFYKSRPGGEQDSFVQALEPHFASEGWREVIPMAGVLSGRRAGQLVDSLAGQLSESCLDLPRRRGGTSMTRWSLASVLAQVLGDEPALAPPVAERACRALALSSEWSNPGALSTTGILKSRYSSIFLESTAAVYLEGGATFWLAGSVYADLNFAQEMARVRGNVPLWEAFPVRELNASPAVVAEWEAVVSRALEQLGSASAPERAKGGLLAMKLAFHALGRRSRLPGGAEILRRSDAVRLMAPLLDGLGSASRPQTHACAWALAWLTDVTGLDPDWVGSGAGSKLLAIWEANDDEVGAVAAWAFGQLPTEAVREAVAASDAERLVAWAGSQWETGANPVHGREDRRPAALLLAHVLGGPWTAAELREHAQDLPGREKFRIHEALGVEPRRSRFEAE